MVEMGLAQIVTSRLASVSHNRSVTDQILSPNYF
jgi:hypothetical protein